MQELKVEDDFKNHSYKITYRISMLESTTTYLDFKCSNQEYEEWVEFHKQSRIERMREIHINNLLKNDFGN